MKTSTTSKAILCILLTAYMGLSIDILLPSLASISSYFSIQRGVSQLTISTFLLGFAIFQLIQGSLSDYLGRANVLFVSLFIYVFGTLVASMSFYFWMLISGRLLQAFGTASATVSCYAITCDLFEDTSFKKVISYAAVSRSIFPIAFSILGGGIAHYLGWRIVFIFAGFVGLLVFIYAKMTLKNTEEDLPNKKLKLNSIYIDYKQILTNVRFLVFNFFCIAEFSILLTYLSAIPFLFSHWAPSSHLLLGVYIGLNSVFLALGSYCTSYLVQQYEEDKIVLCGFIILIFSSILIAIFIQVHKINQLTLLIPFYLSSFGVGITSPASVAGLLKPFNKISGQVSALSGFIRFLFASCISNSLLYLSSLLYGISLVIGVFSIISISLLTFYKFTENGKSEISN